MKKIAFVGNVGLVINSFIKEYIIELSQENKVYLIYNSNTEPRNINFPDTVQVVHYNVQRKFGLSDFKFFIFLYKFFSKNDIDVTISITPKVGFLTNITAFLVRVPIRIHFFTGQIWINLKGAKRVVLKSMDKLLFSATTHQLIDSPTQLAFFKAEGFSIGSNANTVHKGSICGVDIDRFRRNETDRRDIRLQYGIDDLVVLLYVGRLDPAKGVMDLLDAFKEINRKDICLLMVGPDEMNINVILTNIEVSGKIIYHGMTDQPQRFYSAADIFCYVSHREGFGLSAIEASACELPVIGTNIVGLSDAVSDGVTGLLVEPSNKLELVMTINKLVNDIRLREEMGRLGRLYVQKFFSKNHVQSGYLDLFKKIIG